MEETLPPDPQSGEQQSLPQQPPQARPPSPPQTQQSSSVSSLQQPSTSSSAIPASPNPNPALKPQPQSDFAQQPQHSQQPTSQITQTRLPFSRPWQQPQFSHFSSSPLTPPVPSFSSSVSSSLSTPPVQRGGMAIGVPAHPPGPPLPSPSFTSLNSSSFGQQFGRGTINVPDSVPSTNTSQVRQPVQGLGMMGSLGSSSSMRPIGGSAAHQPRPVQSSLRPLPSTNSQSPTSQGQGVLRASSAGSPSSPSPIMSQSMQTQNQPWLSSGSQGKPPLPPPVPRPQLGQSLQQRSHISQQQQVTLQQIPSSLQQSPLPSASNQQQEQFAHHMPASRVQQSLVHQQQITRGQGFGNLKPPPSPLLVQSSALLNRPAAGEANESSDRILSKRTIQELVTQIDPSEKLDADVEDILLDIADEFIESTVTFGCSLAKHRKSTTLEAKDMLLHLERNWHMTFPGFGGDEIKAYKKQVSSDIHRERLTAIKKSTVANEAANTKIPGGQVGGNAKSHLAKAPANILGSPNL